MYSSYMVSVYYFFFPNLGFPSRDRTRTRAMEFLHEMDYNYTKTKFYLLFPYYLAYNRVRLHQPLQLTNS